MARPKKATVEYFQHYTTHGKTMYTIEAKYGNDGYAFWFKLLELLGSTEQHFIDCNLDEEFEYLLACTRFNQEKAIEILNLLSKIVAIDTDLWEYKVIWSANFISNLAPVYSRRDVIVYDKSALLDYCIHKYPVSGTTDNICPHSIVENRVSHSIVEDTPDNRKPVNRTSTKTLDVESFNLTPELETVMIQFIDHRKQLKSPLTQNALELSVKKLYKICNGNESLMIDTAENSIASGWKSFYLHENNGKKLSKGEKVMLV